MALGFNYTLSPDETASWTEFQDFVKKISKEKIQIGLNFEPQGGTRGGSGGSGGVPAGIDKQIKLIQERLYNSLNNLTIKADKNLLEGIIPVDEISKAIEQLGKSGESLNQIRSKASEIRIEMQQWGQVLTNDKALLEGVNDLQGQINQKIAQASKQRNSDEIVKLKQDTDKWLQSEIEAIKKTKEFQVATEAQKTAFDKLTSSMEINAYSVEGLNKQKEQLKKQLEEQRQIFRDRYLDEAQRKYDDLQGTIKNLVVRYVSLQAVLHTAKAQFLEAKQYIMDVDEAFTNMSMTMESMTKTDFNNMVGQISKMSQEMGGVTSDVLKIAQTFANDQTSIQEVMDKLTSSTALMNISGMDATEVTKSVMSIANSYQLLEKDGSNAAEVTEYLGDVLAKTSANMSMDFVEGMQGLINGIGVAGSTMKAAGVDMEWYVGMLGNIMVATGQSADVLGRSMRTITARVMQQKQALEEMGESVEEVEISMAKGEKTLNEIGIRIRDDLSGDLRSFSDIMDDLGAKWDGLTDSTKYFLAEQLAGKNQMDVFIGMMDSYQSGLDLVNNAYDAQGTLMEMNGVYADSLQGKINTLTSAQQSLYQTFFNSDAFKVAIDGCSSLINTLTLVIDKFGSIPTVITAVSTAFLSLNSAGRNVTNSFMNAFTVTQNLNQKLQEKTERLKDVIAEQLAMSNSTNGLAKAMTTSATSTGLLGKVMGQFNTTLIKAQLELVGTTLATHALQAAMSFGLSLAIGAIVSGVGKLIQALKDYSNYAERAKEATENITKLSSELENLTTGDIGTNISDLDKMVQKYNDINTTQEEKAKLSEEINRLKQQLIGYDDEYARILNNEKLSYEEQLGLLKQINKEKALETAQDLEKTIKKSEKDGSSSTGQWNYNQLTSNAKNIAELEKAIQEAQNGLGTYRGEKTSVEKLEQILNDQKKRYQEHYLFLLDYNNKVEQIRNAGIDTDLQYFDVTKFQDMFHDLATSISDAVEEGSSKILVPIKTAKDKLQDFFGTDYDSSDVRGAFDAVVSACGGVQEGTEEAREALALLKQTFPQLGSEVDTLSEAIAYLGNKSMLETRAEAEELVEILNKLKESEQDALDTSTLTQLLDMYPELGSHINDVAYIQEFLNDKIQEMQQVNDNVYSSLLATDENFWNQKIKNSDEWLAHEKDVQNAITQLGAEMLGIQEQDFVDFINSKGGLRDVDLSNAKNAANAEGKLSADLLNQLLGWYSQYVGEKGGARITDLDNVAEFLNEQGGMEAKTIKELVAMWDTYYNAKKAEIQNSLALLSNSINAGNPYQDLGNLTPEQSAQLAELNKQMVNLEKSAAAMGNFFNNVTTSFKGVSSSLSQASASVGKIGSGKGPSSSSSSSNKGSSSSKDVADLELAIDRYYELNDALQDVNNALEKNKIQRDNADTIKEYNRLVEEEVRLTNQKIQALENLRKEQEKEASELKNALKSQGVNFDSDGNITNYASRLQSLQNAANKLTGEAKENAIANANAVKDMIEQYTTLTNSTIPGTANQILEMKKEVENIRKEQEEMVKQVERLGERYYTVLQAITKVDNRLELIRAKQENAHGKERVELLNQEIELLRERQKLVQQQQKEMTTEATELYKELKEQGVQFDSDGYIQNYDKLMKQLTDKANSLVGDSRDAQVKKAEELIELIEKYDDLVKNSLPGLGVEWVELNNEIIALEKSKLETVADVEKQITNAITSELQKRTDATKKEIEKQKQLYLDAYEEEDYQTELAKEQRKLDEIQQQINNLARDTSLAGQLKLQELMQQYQEQQDAINNMIRDHEKQQGSDRFDEEMEKLDEKLENALEPENMAQIVADALTTGLVSVGDEVIRLDQLMADFAVESEGAITALSSTIRAEMIESLREASELVNDLGTSYQALIGYNETLTQNRAAQNVNNANSRSVTPSIEFNAPILTVEGDITQDVDSKLSELANQVEQTVLKTVTRALSTI